MKKSMFLVTFTAADGSTYAIRVSATHDYKAVSKARKAMGFGCVNAEVTVTLCAE